MPTSKTNMVPGCTAWWCAANFLS